MDQEEASSENAGVVPAREGVVFRRLAAMVEAGEAGVLATVTRTSRSTPRHAGSKMIVHADGSVTGSVGGGAAEARVIREAQAVLMDGQCRNLQLDLAGDLGVCGGTMEVFLEAVLSAVPFWVIGAGHIGRALTELGWTLPFRFILVDDRPEFLPEGGQGGGPAILRPPAAPLEGMGEPSPNPGSCDPASPRFHACLMQEARVAAAAGDLPRVVARCSAIQGDEGETAEALTRWRQDCYFTAAENILPNGEPYRAGMALCARAGTFSPECHGHLLANLPVPEVSPHDDPDAVYRMLIRNAAMIWSFWGARDSTVFGVTVDLYWAMSAPRLYQSGAPEVQDPFTRLPPEVAPHLRDVLSMALIGEPDPLSEIQAVLRREKKPPPVRYPMVIASSSGGRTWLTDLPGEESIPATWFLDSACRRPSDPDADVDLRLSLATAASRHTPARLDLILPDLASSNDIIRWNAAMILSSLQRWTPELAQLASDPDPRIWRRVELARANASALE